MYVHIFLLFSCFNLFLCPVTGKRFYVRKRSVSYISILIQKHNSCGVPKALDNTLFVVLG